MTGVNRVCCPWIIVANCSLRKADDPPLARGGADETDACNGSTGDNGSTGANIDRNKYRPGRQSKRQAGLIYRDPARLLPACRGPRFSDPRAAISIVPRLSKAQGLDVARCLRVAFPNDASEPVHGKFRRLCGFSVLPGVGGTDASSSTPWSSQIPFRLGFN